MEAGLARVERRCFVVFLHQPAALHMATPQHDQLAPPSSGSPTRDNPGLSGPVSGTGTLGAVASHRPISSSRDRSPARFRGAATVAPVTLSSSPSAPQSGSLAVGASPGAIRSGLFAEDRPEFDAAYGSALDEARRTYELAPVHEVLEQWRRRAILQSDPDAFRRSVRRAAEFYTGQPVPDGEPSAVTRANAGL